MGSGGVLRRSLVEVDFEDGMKVRYFRSCYGTHYQDKSFSGCEIWVLYSLLRTRHDGLFPVLH